MFEMGEICYPKLGLSDESSQGQSLKTWEKDRKGIIRLASTV
jgi:hypothetical protein